MNRACLNVLVLFLVSFVVSSAAKKCTLKGFPEKMRFRVLSYNDLDHLPTDPDRKPDLETTLNTKLINSTQCRYTGEWPEIKALFLGFYNPNTRTLHGAWAMFAESLFGTIKLVWNGETLEGKWDRHPDAYGYDHCIPIQNYTPVV